MPQQDTVFSQKEPESQQTLSANQKLIVGNLLAMYYDRERVKQTQSDREELSDISGGTTTSGEATDIARASSISSNGDAGSKATTTSWDINHWALNEPTIEDYLRVRRWPGHFTLLIDTLGPLLDRVFEDDLIAQLSEDSTRRTIAFLDGILAGRMAEKEEEPQLTDDEFLRLVEAANFEIDTP